MKSIQETRERWLVTRTHTTLEDLKNSVRLKSAENPCRSGLRSICWKAFLLFQSTDLTDWSRLLTDSREAYTALKTHFLRLIEHPYELSSGSDPLDDDQGSRWNTFRKDEELRAEIFQDVERCMPEEDYFRQPVTQKVMLDVLFVFCKINQDTGYRQGMHELLAPLLWVVELDAIATTSSNGEIEADFTHADIKLLLDKQYIEHDAFTLFALLMRPAKSFYELGELGQPSTALPTALGVYQQQMSPIVERSKRIHETYLAQLDPELARHLTEIEVLPQIYLIRWIRLLFGREFPFEDLLCLWDIILAEDPGLDLVDMICISMLLRIRWQLVEANYSTALMLLLKYPMPSPPHDSQSFVDDAMYVRDNFSAAGGAKIIQMYSGKAPSLSLTRPSTPNRTVSPQHESRVKSPMNSPARFLQQQGGVEAMIQGAARGVYDRGERLGINKAVRDAVGEVRKNIEVLQTSRSNSFQNAEDSPQWSLDKGRHIPSSKSCTRALTARNQELAKILDQATSELRVVADSKRRGEPISLADMNMVMSKMDFVKTCLEDSTITLPADTRHLDILRNHVDNTIIPQTSSSDGSLTPSPSVVVSTPDMVPQQGLSLPEDPSNGDIEGVSASKQPSPVSSGIDSEQRVMSEGRARPIRPKAPIPTRSSIAQSSFAWMLEGPSSSTNVSSSPPRSPFTKQSKKVSGPGREKAAFLFGEEVEGVYTSSPKSQSPIVDTDEIFKLRTIRGGKGPL